MNFKKIALLVRLVYISVIIMALFNGNIQYGLLNLSAFLISMIGIYLTRYDEKFWIVDLLFSILFISCMLAYWDTLIADRVIVGLDTFFHFIAGMIMALFWHISLRKYIENDYVFYLSILAFSLALGAMWEVVEWLFLLSNKESIYDMIQFSDTMVDLIADSFGALAMCVILWLKK